jgi:hypothetical protein
VTAPLSSLREDELDLLRETEPERMADLDEDETLDLHTRIRRARTKYVKLYRRQASDRVADLGGRGFARPKNRRNADKAEVFEEALARVSKRVDVVARRAAAELKAERLAAARATSPGPRADGRDVVTPDAASRVPAHAKTTGGVKRDASSRAEGARRQAARDGR